MWASRDLGNLGGLWGVFGFKASGFRVRGVWALRVLGLAVF